MNSSRKTPKSSALNGSGAGGKTPTSKVPLKGGGNGSTSSTGSSLSQSRGMLKSFIMVIVYTCAGYFMKL